MVNFKKIPYFPTTIQAFVCSLVRYEIEDVTFDNTGFRSHVLFFLIFKKEYKKEVDINVKR